MTGLRRKIDNSSLDDNLNRYLIANDKFTIDIDDTMITVSLNNSRQSTYVKTMCIMLQRVKSTYILNSYNHVLDSKWNVARQCTSIFERMRFLEIPGTIYFLFQVRPFHGLECVLCC